MPRWKSQQRGMLLALGLGLVHSAAAGEPQQPFRVEFQATGGCAAQEEFVWQVRNRARELRPARGSERAFVFTLRVLVDREHVYGVLVVLGPDGTRTTRWVAGDSCSEVVSALALVAVMLVEGAPSGPPAPSQPPPRPPPSWRFGVQPGFVLQTGVAPGPLLAPALEVEVLAPAVGPLAPALAVSAQHGHSGRLETRGGTAELQWSAVRLRGCPVRWPARSPVGFRPCLWLDVGVVAGKGTETQHPATRTSAWLTPGLGLSWELVPYGPFVLAAEGGLLVPIVRSHFYFGPAENVYRTPSVSLSAGVRLGLRFP